MYGKAIFVICITYARQQELGPNADDKGGSRIMSGGQVENASEWEYQQKKEKKNISQSSVKTP